MFLGVSRFISVLSLVQFSFVTFGSSVFAVCCCFIRSVSGIQGANGYRHSLFVVGDRCVMGVWVVCRVMLVRRVTPSSRGVRVSSNHCGEKTNKPD
jgi:hypothetical protein